jgi:hypothetical protein
VTDFTGDGPVALEDATASLADEVPGRLRGRCPERAGARRTAELIIGAAIVILLLAFARSSRPVC